MPTKIEMVFNKETGAYEVELIPGEKETPGELSASALDKVSDFKVMDLDLGEVAVGLGVAGAGDILVHFLEPFTRNLPAIGIGGQSTENVRKALMLVVAAWVAKRDQVKGFVGDEGAEMGSKLLLADAVATLFNVRGQVGNLAHSLGVGSHAGRGLRREFNVPRRSLPDRVQNNPVASAATSRSALVGV